MKNSGILQKDVFNFFCSKRLQYGTRIALVNEPKKIHDEWLVTALLSPSQSEEIVAGTFPVSETSFLVLRCEQSKQNRFSCTAVTTEWLDQSSEEVENGIISVLRHP